MKKISIAVIALSAIILSACNSGGNTSEHEGHDMSKMGDTTNAATTNDKEAKLVAVKFTDVDIKVAASIKETVDHYLHVKNALASDNADEAAKGGKAMVSTLSKLDKSLFTADQKNAFDEIQDDLKEHAEHIGKNAGDIKHQREHFIGMSEDIYTLVTNFGGGRVLYHDHCPMVQDNKGAMWVSEIKDIKNPYFGAQMPNCGSVEEVIQ
ncbi:MAG TPA: DUF3347 domain-containing protein [Phnomibacter sp.]|nr:DUF3347 domain-containing protein [Phnomibacter sp.]